MKNLYLLILASFSIQFSIQAQIVVYDEDFSGANITISSNWNIADADQIWNDRISSIDVVQGYKIILFENQNFTGEQLEITKATSFKDNLAHWNDRVSSLKIIQITSGFSLYYTTYYEHGGQWIRMDDFVLNSAGNLFYGTGKIENPKATGKMISWNQDQRNQSDGAITFNEESLSGWIKYPGLGKVTIKGEFIEKVQNTYPPFVARRSSASPPSNFVNLGTNSTGAVKLYLSDDFKGESKLITENWSPEGFDESYKWGGKINSIKVPEGWSIRMYRFSKYGGSYLEMSDDWSAKDYPDWENEIESIKIVRKQENTIYPYQQSISNGIKIYLTEDYTGESKLISSDWNPKNFEETYKWGGEINSIRIPEGWAIRMYRFSDFSGPYLEMSDDWSAKDFPDWANKIECIKIIRKP